MRVILLLSLVVAVSAYVEVSTDYHIDIGIPTATRIKEQEDRILAAQNTGSRIVGGSEAPPNAHPYLVYGKSHCRLGPMVHGLECAIGDVAPNTFGNEGLGGYMGRQSIACTGAPVVLKTVLKLSNENAGLVISFFNHPGQSACGASLVSSNRLVTAAHCWDTPTLQARQFIVVLGSQFLFSGGTRIATTQVVLHPQWSPANLGNDVAIIYLPTRVSFNERIRPINLPNLVWETFVGSTATAAGYGLTSDSQTGVSVNSVVSHVNLQVITVNQCRSVFGPVFVQQSTLCTDGTGGVGICRGDSGGPLVLTRFGQPILIGVSSFVANIGCEFGFPSAFARVTSFTGFIRQHL